MQKNNFKNGFTLMELLVSVSIMTLLIITATTFQKDIFSLNNTLQSSLNAQLDARHLIKIMVTEMRKTSQSALGAYPIEVASSTAVTFYSDVGNDGVIDRVRYFLSDTNIRKGVTTPTGNPITYNPANEVLTTLVSSFVASSTLPLFQYYPATYAGTSSPLSEPVSILSVRLIKINIIIDANPNRSPVPLIVTSVVSLRNLKDNL